VAHARRCDHDEENLIRFLTRQAALVCAATVGVCTVTATANGDPIAAKRAQAQAVLAQLAVLDGKAQRANNAYQSATDRLHVLERNLLINRQALGVARANLRQSQKVLEQRLVAIYTTRDDQSTLAVVLGAKSLSDLVNRVETIQSVSSQDAAVIHQVITFHHQVVRHRAFLRHAKSVQAQLVAQRAAAKLQVQAQLAHEQRLYNSVKSELSQLIAQQRARQLAAARAAQAQAAAQAAAVSQQQTGFGVSASVGTAAVAPPSKYTGVVGIAMRYLGVPYVWGGASPSGFDCSGFVMYVYAQVGVSLPHYTGAQWSMGVPVAKGDLEPGDLVFFDGLGHVGIYIGGGEFIHAPHTGTVVQISSLNSGWYAATYDGARRITG
jgi:peptidoglycan DL-endopeptidase CwlO